MSTSKSIIFWSIVISGLLVSVACAETTEKDAPIPKNFSSATEPEFSRQRSSSDQISNDAPTGIPIMIPEKKGAPSELRILYNKKDNTDRSLLVAAENGDLQKVSKLLQSDIKTIHQRDGLERTSLMLAAQKGYAEIVNVLLDAGADPNAKDQQNQTALTYAAMAGHDNVIKSLVAAHANIEIVDNDGRTPLIWAIFSKNTTAVSLLVKAGADVNRQDLKGISPLIYSFGMDNPNITRLLIESGADIDKVLKGSRMDTLMLAAWQGDTGIIKLLINKGMDVNARNTAGVTPLLTAIASNQKAATRALLDSGAKVNDKDIIGRSAIFYSAIAKIDPEIALILIEKGASLNEKEKNGFTPLSLAAANGNSEVIKVLIEAGLSASGTAVKGEFSPLMSAAANLHPAVVEQLLSYELDIDARGPDGKTALMWAAKYNCLKCVELLLSSGAKTDLVDEKNLTSLDYAKQNRKANKIVELLETKQNLQ